MRELVGRELTVFKHLLHEEEEHARGLSHVSDGEVLKVDETTEAKVLHTPGHTKDHISVWLRETGDLFTGDCVVGGRSAQFDDFDEQLKSLKRLQGLEGLKRLNPGKGSCERDDPYAKVGE